VNILKLPLKIINPLNNFYSNNVNKKILGSIKNTHIQMPPPTGQSFSSKDLQFITGPTKYNQNYANSLESRKYGDVHAYPYTHPHGAMNFINNKKNSFFKNTKQNNFEKNDPYQYQHQRSKKYNTSDNFKISNSTQYITNDTTNNTTNTSNYTNYSNYSNFTNDIPRPRPQQSNSIKKMRSPDEVSHVSTEDINTSKASSQYSDSLFVDVSDFYLNFSQDQDESDIKK
jgi:hypothetical protein